MRTLAIAIVMLPLWLAAPAVVHAQPTKAQTDCEQSWDATRRLDVLGLYDYYLKKCPEGPMLDEARAKLAAKCEGLWKDVMRNDTLYGYSTYLEKCPQGAMREEAKAKVDNQCETLLWKQAVRADSIKGYQGYLDKCPKGSMLDEAKTRVTDKCTVLWQEASGDQTQQRLASYVDDCPGALMIGEATSRLEGIRYQDAIQTNAAWTYKKFLASYPNSSRAAEIFRRLSRFGVIRLTKTTVVSHDVLSKTYGWNKTFTAAVCGERGGIMSVNNSGEKVLTGPWCIGNLHVTGQATVKENALEFGGGTTILISKDAQPVDGSPSPQPSPTSTREREPTCSHSLSLSRLRERVGVRVDRASKARG